MRVAVVGYAGKMGRATVEAIEAANDLTLAARVGSGDELELALRESGSEVAIDFTTPRAVLRTLPTYLELGVSPVVGTTGLPSSRGLARDG